MKLLQLFAWLFLSSFLTALSAQQIIPFSDKRWSIQAQGSLQEPFRGYPSLYLQNGIALLKDEKFSNGIIEFDMYQSDRPSFSGFIFRVKDATNYEEIYLRSHQSGNPDAFQYTPVFNGDPAWQLYHDPHDAVNDGFTHWRQRGRNMGYNTVVDYAFNRWTHVKLLVRDSEAELYIDDMDKPVAFIRELLTGFTQGGLGVKSGNGATWYANFRFMNKEQIEFRSRPEGFKQSTPEGTITRWQVSQPFREDLSAKMTRVDNKWIHSLKWNSLNTEATGLANLSRLAAIADSNNTVMVKSVVISDSDQIKKLEIGYSDRIKVFINGIAHYNGNAGFRTRDYRYLGTIGYFEAVYLPLKKGENTILFAVSETFGGWGIMAKWDQLNGIIMK